MLKKHLRTLILTSIITILPVFIGLILWNRLPDVMATHFDSSNIANGFESKAFAVFGLPLILLAVQWVAAVFIANDPRRQNISSLMFTLVLWIVPVVSLICGAAIYTYNPGSISTITKWCRCCLARCSSSSASSCRKPGRTTRSVSDFPGPWQMRRTGPGLTASQVSSGSSGAR